MANLTDLTAEKAQLRRALRRERSALVESLPASVHALAFRRPPSPLRPWFEQAGCVGLYAPIGSEAPTDHYVDFLAEIAKPIAFPAMRPDADAVMTFRLWDDPETLESGPFGIAQPPQGAETVTPDLLIVPLIGFDDKGNRLGQGGGHYDRYLAAHPGTRTIGLAWSCQQRDCVPSEPHDQRLDAVVTQSSLILTGDDLS